MGNSERLIRGLSETDLGDCQWKQFPGSDFQFSDVPFKMLLGWISTFRQKRRSTEKSQPVRQTENPGCTKTAKQWCSREQPDFPVFLVFMLTSLSVVSLKTVWKIKFTKRFLISKQQINRLFPQIQQTSPLWEENLAHCRHLVRGDAGDFLWPALLTLAINRLVTVYPIMQRTDTVWHF